MSYLLTAACIISTAQQASPNVSGHNDPARAQFIKDKILEDIHSTFIIYTYPYLRASYLNIAHTSADRVNVRGFRASTIFR